MFLFLVVSLSNNLWLLLESKLLNLGIQLQLDKIFAVNFVEPVMRWEMFF